jgi:hypothetical protein
MPKVLAPGFPRRRCQADRHAIAERLPTQFAAATLLARRRDQQMLRKRARYGFA